MQTAESVSNRRGSANTYLLSVNSLIVTVYGFANSKGGMPDLGWTWLVPLVGLNVSLSWYALIGMYRNLNSAKFQVIHALETELAGRLFDAEWDMLKRGEMRKHIALSQIESWIPITFAVLYLVLLGHTVMQ